MTITGIASSGSTLSNHSVDVTNGRNSKVQFSASVLSKLTKVLPNGLIDTTRTRNLRMADPESYKPSKIDILLGADISEQLMLSGKLEETDKLFLRETLFGWVLIGGVDSTV